jgi:predicted HTH transcriptional regulator
LLFASVGLLYSKRNIEANISDLKKKGIIERVGSRKNGYWEVRENGI